MSVTSLKPVETPVGVGDPAARHRKVTASARVTVRPGEKVPAPVPWVISSATAQSTASA